jgi:hypothetical protein
MKIELHEMAFDFSYVACSIWGKYEKTELHKYYIKIQGVAAF